MCLEHEHQSVLAVGAHTDDIELGCGGLLSIYAARGYRIRCIVFSRSEESLPIDFPRDTLVREFEASMTILGVENYEVENIPVRYFSDHRQAILEKLVSIRKEFKPDIVLTFNSFDTHQDHSVVHQESIRAFRDSNIYGYELPWNYTQINTNMFVEISDYHLNKKIDMVLSYRSQVILNRTYINRDYVITAAKFRGYQAKMQYAEAYEVIRQRW
ncbi:PIG-L deacetylase family protein [Deinococcus sp. MIMF12]|uniref:PIG-L deacetylase family protein n=1 Tax=Deinococcus rhizophilus TaxID=3049544 RepID=A0ABT7JDI0_9DEIO|nr:PIG-L deacetylase family protein [Deinococcus rhizophilus]MDL2343001.1 PIG-L deacetylase family protein [Deinococcus rhizophilus]